MTLWLIGMMGSGKSAAGRMAASSLDVEFWDTDAVVAERLGCSIAQLWGSVGEGVFRDMEKVATRLVAGRGGVIATGGGVVADEDNRDVISGSGKVIWLDAPANVLAARVGDGHSRPLLADSEPVEALESLLAERVALYEELSDVRIETGDKDLATVATEIEAQWVH